MPAKGTADGRRATNPKSAQKDLKRRMGTQLPLLLARHCLLSPEGDEPESAGGSCPCEDTGGGPCGPRRVAAGKP
jgi:hypothetical protein